MRAQEFLDRFRPGGPWVLTAIAVDQKAIDTATLKTPEEVATWLERYPERNHYFSVNPTTRPVDKKASRADVAALEWLHVDIDFDQPGDRERVLRILERPPGGVPRPTCVVFSGGGYQAFWRLLEALQIDGDLARAEEAKLYNLQLELLFGADNCHNVDRIMRLPGTINWPNEKKRKRGREEALAEVEWFDEARYPLESFTRAARASSDVSAVVEVSGNVRRLEDVHELDRLLREPPSDLLKVLIVQGNRPDGEEPYPSRSEALFRACCELVRLGADDDLIYSVITDPDFGISASVLDKGSGVERYAVRQIERAREEDVDPWLRKLNDRYVVVSNASGKCRVAEEVLDEVLNKTTLTFMSFLDFQHVWMNQKIEVYAGQDKDGSPQTKKIAVGDWWLRHEKRRQVDKIVFAPGRDVPGAYNLWRGFSVDAVPGECSLLLDHARDVICSGDEGHYRYLLGWMARAVQRPGSPGRTAVVMRGRQGAGKSFFADQLGRLFGRHYLTVSNSKHLVGNFNAHLHDCVLLFGDEAFYARDKRHESVLKTLVTEEKLVIERKGLDAQLASNCVHLMMASNDEWVVPAGVDDRRFFCLDVSDARACDVPYFRKIHEQMKTGGYEALLHYLLNYDLTGFEVRKVPDTAALKTQKTLTLGSAEKWWLQKLRDGKIHESHDGWETRPLCAELQYDFFSVVRSVRNERGSATELGIFLKRACGIVPKKKRSTPAEVPGLDGRIYTSRRPLFYCLPGLAECRARWDEEFFPEEWEDVPDEEDEGTES